MTKTPLSQIAKELKKAKSAIITAHIDPDGDAIGSSLAMAGILSKLNIASFVYAQDGIPKTYHFLPGIERIKNKVPPNLHFDLAITLDSSDLSRVGDKIDLKTLANKIINIDHHPDNDMYGAVNFVSASSSTAELIFELAQYLHIKLDLNIAECLYVAMITDTGNFRYENTRHSTFLMAADLVATGLSIHDICTHIYDTKSIAAVKINSLALSNLEFSKNFKVAWTMVTQEMMKRVNAQSEDLVGIVDQIRSIEGVEVAILFREDQGKIKINLRSKQNVNVSEIAGCFGGGGHFKAAGIALDGPIEKARDKVVLETLKFVEAARFLV